MEEGKPQFAKAPENLATEHITGPQIRVYVKLLVSDHVLFYGTVHPKAAITSEWSLLFYERFTCAAITVLRVGNY